LTSPGTSSAERGAAAIDDMTEEPIVNRSVWKGRNAAESPFASRAGPVDSDFDPETFAPRADVPDGAGCSAVLTS
jgi:hypothetical protein